MLHHNPLLNHNDLIIVGIDRECPNTARLILTLAHSGLFTGQFSNLEGVSHVAVEGEGGTGENVGGGLEDHFGGAGVDPVDFDAAAGFVDYGEGAFGGCFGGGEEGGEKEEEGEDRIHGLCEYWLMRMCLRMLFVNRHTSDAGL